MIVSEKSHQNLSEYIQFLFRKIFKFDKKVGLFLEILKISRVLVKSSTGECFF